MAYLAGLIIVGLFVLVIKYFLELTKKQELIAGLSVLFIVLGAVAFNAYSANQRALMLGVVSSYKQGKTVNCEGIDVNSTNFTLSIGTYTFIGKKDTPNYTIMISASSCR